MSPQVRNSILIGGGVLVGAVAGGVGVYLWREQVWQGRLDEEMAAFRETYAKSQEAWNVQRENEYAEQMEEMKQEHIRQIKTIQEAYNQVFEESGVVPETSKDPVETQSIKPKNDYRDYKNIVDRYTSNTLEPEAEEQKEEEREMPRIPKRREGMPYLISEDQHIEILQEVTTIYLEYYRDDLLVQADGVPLGGMTYDNLVGDDNLAYLKVLGEDGVIHVKAPDRDMVYEITYVNSDFMDSDEHVADVYGIGFDNDRDYYDEEDEW